MAQYTFNVEMSCSGCSNAVNKALSRLEGIEKIDISLEKQEVVVDTELPRETVLAAIKKTGKTVKDYMFDNGRLLDGSSHWLQLKKEQPNPIRSWAHAKVEIRVYISSSIQIILTTVSMTADLPLSAAIVIFDVMLFFRIFCSWIYKSLRRS
ncbi:copper chaperone taha [Mucor ambiguus]|uniref:Copper chaperone taha n=1 Tax=Mucor ambiguus TaxID=91626 RepID=A0A0C9MGE6_9FUNG|nr:copper chaperone taha [Mucor ambiguus]